MRFLFLYSNLKTGGVQTLLLRMAKWLAMHGHSVDVYVASAGGGTIYQALKRYAKVVVLGPKLYQIFQFHSITCSWGRYLFPSYDVVHAFDPIGMWISANISSCYGVRFVSGIYHPEYYQFRVTNLGGSYYPKEYEDLISVLPDNAFLFMNEASLDAHARYYVRPFTNSFVLPLAVLDYKQDMTLQSQSVSRKTLRLVSVGRLVNFKRYPLGVMDVIRFLRQKGYDITFEIYGTGPLEPVLKSYAQRNGYTDFVAFRGLLPYDQFPYAVGGAFAFVGMGTSVVESAILGVPSIVMPMYGDGHECYGYLSEQSGFNLGETGEPRSLSDELVKLLDLSEREYKALAQRERQAALRFSADRVLPLYLTYTNNFCRLTGNFKFPSSYRHVLWKKLVRKVQK